MSDDRVIKSYVWHAGQCFFVSTIERDSSAVGGPRRYNETMVWRYDWEKQERAPDFISQTDDSTRSIGEHQSVCLGLFEYGAEYLAKGAE